MFHLIMTLSYVLPNIYVFLRINHLFISRRYKLLFFLIYLAFFLIYPFVGRSSHEDENAIMQFLSTVSGYLLPFYLYLFLSVLIYDLFLIVNYFLKIVSVEKRKQFIYRYRILTAMILVSVAVVVVGVINLNTIRVSRYTIEVNGRNSKLEKLRIAFVADFHIDYKTRMAYVEQFVKKTNALKPDLVLYGGDIVEGNRKNRSVEDALKKIKAPYGIYGVLGNHEFYRGQEDGRFFRRSDIKLLNDTVINVNNLFYLGGRVDQQYQLRKSAHEVLKGISADLPVIMMDHRPTELKDVSKRNVDVQFSGHTHNGQLFPINFIIKGMYELSWGYKKIRDTHFFVTSGLRLWGPPVKTAGKSEIMLVDITFKK